MGKQAFAMPMPKDARNYAAKSIQQAHSETVALSDHPDRVRDSMNILETPSTKIPARALMCVTVTANVFG
jgi:hypothetical protein